MFFEPACYFVAPFGVGAGAEAGHAICEDGGSIPKKEGLEGACVRAFWEFWETGT